MPLAPEYPSVKEVAEWVAMQPPIRGWLESAAHGILDTWCRVSGHEWWTIVPFDFDTIQCKKCWRTYEEVFGPKVERWVSNARRRNKDGARSN